LSWDERGIWNTFLLHRVAKSRGDYTDGAIFNHHIGNVGSAKNTYYTLHKFRNNVGSRITIKDSEVNYVGKNDGKKFIFEKGKAFRKILQH